MAAVEPHFPTELDERFASALGRLRRRQRCSADQARSKEVYLRERCFWVLLLLLFYQAPKRESWMVIPRANSSLSNFVTAGDISPSPGTTTAHSKFSRNSREMICHWVS